VVEAHLSGQRHGCGDGWHRPRADFARAAQAAGIDQEAMLLGMGNHFELWDKATYDEQEAKAMQGDARGLQGFSF
jgi:hypothetical protein